MRETCDDCAKDRWTWQGCGKGSCEQDGCRRHFTNRRAARAWAKLQAFESAPWGVVVLTIPGEVRDVLRYRDANATIRRRAVDVVKAWAIRWGFHGVPVRLGGSVVAHPCGENPDIWAPHFNVIFPWVGETDDGSYRIGRYHLDPRALDDLRLRWAMELVDLGWTPTCSPQVDYEFRKTERAKRHAARYFFRSFPAWQAWTHRVFWWGILAHSVEAHDPPTWSTPTKLGRCPDCNGYTRSVESVRRGHWSARAADGSWHRLEGVPPGKWGNVFLGSS